MSKHAWCAGVALAYFFTAGCGNPQEDGGPTEITTATTADHLRDDVLIVANRNSQGSLGLAEFYRNLRNISAENVAQIHAPNEFTIEHDDYIRIREQLLYHVIHNNLIDGAPTFAGCPEIGRYDCAEAKAFVREYSRIRYIAMIKGVPVRLRHQTDPYKPTSIDNYLMFQLLNDIPDDIKPNLSGYTDWEQTFGKGAGFAHIDPRTAGKVVISRVDGFTFDHAKAILRRTIAAEQSGLYGNWITSQLEQYQLTGRIRDYYDSSTVYQSEEGDFWPMLFGLWNEDKYGLCTDHLEFADNHPDGEANPSCAVQLTSPEGVDNRHPGSPNSRVPRVVDASMYIGHLDGQSLKFFDHLLAWRKNATCSEALCSETPDPEACQLASTDVLREINTECVGVADGFVGVNYQSFPAAYFHHWPQDFWAHGRSNQGWKSKLGGDVELGLPFVLAPGRTDNTALWYGVQDRVADALCFANAKIDDGPDAPCDESYPIHGSKYADLSGDVAHKRFQIRFFYKGEGLAANEKIDVYIQGKEPTVDAAVMHLQMQLEIPAGTTAWTESSTVIEVDPALYPTCQATCELEGFRVSLRSVNNIDGRVALDDFSFVDLANGQELFGNGSFDGGFSNTQIGDWPANFMNRLNGVGFWGSLSHHQSGGHSFGAHVLTSFKNFFRGLTLAEAAWFGELHNSGIVYGDPLYSPTAIRLHDLTGDRLNRLTRAHHVTTVDALNGTDADRVQTTFRVDLCPNADFKRCDLDASWMTLVPEQPGGAKSIPVAFDVSNAVPGQNTIKVSVNSHDTVTAKTQTITDLQIYDVADTLDLSIVDDYETYAEDERERVFGWAGLTGGFDEQYWSFKPSGKIRDGDLYLNAGMTVGRENSRETATYRWPIPRDVDGAAEIILDYWISTRSRGSNRFYVWVSTDEPGPCQWAGGEFPGFGADNLIHLASARYSGSREVENAVLHVPAECLTGDALYISLSVTADDGDGEGDDTTVRLHNMTLRAPRP